jgi:hypothetical protein
MKIDKGLIYSAEVRRIQGQPDMGEHTWGREGGEAGARATNQIRSTYVARTGLQAQTPWFVVVSEQKSSA